MTVAAAESGPTRFADASALEAALVSEAIPRAVASAPARVWREADGAIRVAARRANDAGDGDAEDVSCWAEALPMRRVGEPRELGEVVFATADEASLLELAGEMIRLGCDRQEICAAGDRFLLRAIGPPYYSIARAIDHVGGLRAFAGAGGVLVEIGWAHPLDRALRPAEGHALLIEGTGRFAQVPLGDGFHDVQRHVVLDLPAPAPPLAPVRVAGKIQVPLRLVRASRGQAPTLWVLSTDAEAQLDALVETLPEEVVDRLLFAVAEAPRGGRVALVKARPGLRAPPVLDLRALGCAPVLQIPNLFAPVDAAIEPPLRGEVARRLLAPDAERVFWIERGSNERLSVASVAVGAFAPLAEWVEYVMEGGATVLEAWVRGASFAFDDFVVGSEEQDEPELVNEKRGRAKKTGSEGPMRRRSTRGTSGAAPAEAAALVDAESVAAPRVPPPVPPANASRAAKPQTPPAETALVEELAAVERRFLELDAPAEAPARRALWLEMGRLAHALGRRQDAGLHWSRALWDAPDDEARAILGRWAEAEATNVGADDAALDRLLAADTLDRDAIRAAGVLVAAADDARLRPRIGRASGFLDRREADLDLRTLWLARLALSRAAGGDGLGLSRARDTVLARLHAGVSLEREVPRFLRFVGGRGKGDSAATARLVRELVALRGRLVDAPRKRLAVEAPPALTKAYVELTFAYGFARLGESNRAHELAEAAPRALDLSDPVHGFLVRAYRARIEQAMEGLPIETPLPAELAGELNALERFLRYKVDRLRQASRILEPQERLDPVLAFHRGGGDPRGDDLMTLRGEVDRARLAADVARHLERATTSAPEERARLFDGLMDFFPRLPASQAVPHLAAITLGLDGIPAPRRAQLLEEALMLAGHFDHPELARRIVGMLDPVFAELGPEHVGDAAAAVATTQRVLRRVGLRAEAASLVAALRRAAVGPAVPMLLARVALAGASLALDDREVGGPALEEALARLAEDLPGSDRTRLVRGVARAVGSAPQEVALAVLARLSEGIKRVTDSFNTNSHFCLSVIAFAESLVLGYAAEDLALGDLGRQWLDEDEVRIRRRVHRDLASVTGGGDGGRSEARR